MSNSESPYLITTVTKTIREYNPNYGDDRICICGHPYHRHFDSFENNAPVGCKYCHCFTFEDPGPVKEAYKKLLNFSDMSFLTVDAVKTSIGDDLQILLKFVKNRLEAENRNREISHED